ncbi:MAG: tyrosine--tRNA ligase [Candidatus Moranbacteria bacterium CG_4_10_14_3_um_filter_45_9]|nr:MAG: tyrosine--tRNA ligase [Candidatus Moranbacteria bacterium CG2_30_45_14]PIX90335.1 MAG: tyrosine--tRNA ligase [Candidatus Moranbacteria bacterium CG_4_10_14_3_um_filter_45_9]PJA85086.1 MAG: tyrosine--tRNA ligase [Candidatus Moranbacteria bacterium CG_4_9_14_3_um_filter_45_14]
MKNKEQQIEEILTRGVAEAIDREHLKERLLEGKPLRIKFGVDPTSPNLHLGRAVSLLKLRDFQNLGHTVVFIVGDMTGMIGDTSDKDSERPMLTREQVENNMKNYLEQAFKILDKEKTETHYNSEWLSKLGLLELGKMASVFSLHEFSSREVIVRRLSAGQRVSFHEMLYPLFQGYDSVAIKADVELGGTDQRFNLLAGRTLQPKYDQEPQDILMMNLILGTDGRKMSSSWGNTINLLDTQNDMFGKVMSIPDELIMSYFVHCTRVPMEEIAKIAEDIVTGGNPRDAKMRLGKEIVTLYYGEAEAEKAEVYFIETFSKKQIPENVREVKGEKGMKLTDMIVEAGLAESKSDARRKIEQGGVTIADEKITDVSTLIEERFNNQVMRVGKKDFVRVVF